jgi:hypothetical protein
MTGGPSHRILVAEPATETEPMRHVAAALVMSTHAPATHRDHPEDDLPPPTRRWPRMGRHAPVGPGSVVRTSRTATRSSAAAR